MSFAQRHDQRFRKQRLDQHLRVSIARPITPRSHSPLLIRSTICFAGNSCSDTSTSRCALNEFAEGFSNDERRKRRCRRQCQWPARLVIVMLDHAFERIQRRHHLPRMRENPRPQPSKAPCGSRSKEPRVQRSLQLLDLLTQRRLGDSAVAASRRETARLGHIEKIPKLLKRHRKLLSLP